MTHPGTTHTLTRGGAMLDPLQDYIVLHRLDDAAALGNTPSLIQRVAVESDQPKLARVIAVGPGRYADATGVLVPMPDVRVDDLVLTHSGAGTPVRYGGVLYHLVQASRSDIFGVCERASDDAGSPEDEQPSGIWPLPVRAPSRP